MIDLDKLNYKLTIAGSADQPTLVAEVGPGAHVFVAVITGRDDVYRWKRRFVGRVRYEQPARGFIIVQVTELRPFPVIIDACWGEASPTSDRNGRRKGTYRAFCQLDWPDDGAPLLRPIDEQHVIRFFSGSPLPIPAPPRQRARIAWDEEV